MNEAMLVELFGGQGRYRALKELFSEPSRGFGQRELAAAAGLDPGSASRLLKRWVSAGLVERHVRDGLPRYFASSDPALRPLTSMMRQSSEQVRLLGEVLAKLDGVEAAILFGSMARGEGRADSDVDVLVLGSASELKVNAALKPVGRMLGRPVRATVFSAKSFKDQLGSGEGFAQRVMEATRVGIIGDFEAVTRP